jgi:hypothetical protein
LGYILQINRRKAGAMEIILPLNAAWDLSDGFIIKQHVYASTRASIRWRQNTAYNEKRAIAAITKRA